MMKQVVVFLGGFGSGKTECAVNFAINKGKAGYKTVLIDMDIVNPMFRSSIFERELNCAGVTLVASESMRTAEGLPTVADTLRKAFYDDSEYVVLDVGGDKIGAVALGQFHRLFQETHLEKQILFVVNTRRPSMGETGQILQLYEKICRVSRVAVSGFVNNTNLLDESTAEHLLEGDAVLKQVAKLSGKPVLYVSGCKRVLQELQAHYAGKFAGELMQLAPKPRLPWRAES